MLIIFYCFTTFYDIKFVFANIKGYFMLKIKNMVLKIMRLSISH